MHRSLHTLSPLRVFPQHVRERRKTRRRWRSAAGSAAARVRATLLPVAPIDNSAWAVCKISGVQPRTPEVSLKQPDKLSVRCVPAQAGNRSGGVSTSPGHPELYKVNIFFFAFLLLESFLILSVAFFISVVLLFALIECLSAL